MTDEPYAVVFETPQEVEHTLRVEDGEGKLIFAIQSDGTAYLPDPTRAEEAAATFWHSVEEMARIRGWHVRRFAP